SSNISIRTSLPNQVKNINSNTLGNYFMIKHNNNNNSDKKRSSSKSNSEPSLPNVSIDSKNNNTSNKNNKLKDIKNNNSVSISENKPKLRPSISSSSYMADENGG